MKVIQIIIGWFFSLGKNTQLLQKIDTSDDVHFLDRYMKVRFKNTYEQDHAFLRILEIYRKEFLDQHHATGATKIVELFILAQKIGVPIDFYYHHLGRDVDIEVKGESFFKKLIKDKLNKHDLENMAHALEHGEKYLARKIDELRKDPKREEEHEYDLQKLEGVFKELQSNFKSYYQKVKKSQKQQHFA